MNNTDANIIVHALNVESNYAGIDEILVKLFTDHEVLTTIHAPREGGIFNFIKSIDSDQGVGLVEWSWTIPVYRVLQSSIITDALQAKHDYLEEAYNKAKHAASEALHKLNKCKDVCEAIPKS